MANSVATVSLPDNRYNWADRKYWVVFSVVIGASPLVYVTGGITMSFLQGAIKASRTPIFVLVQGQSGYVYEYIPGTDASNGKLKILVQDGTSGNPLAEIAASAIPAGVSGDTINGLAIFFGME